MRIRIALFVMAGVAACGTLPMVGLAQQEGVGAKVGEKLSEAGQAVKKEALKVSEAVAKEFDKVRGDVGKLGIHHRVYTRIHWDKSLHNAKIEVHLFKGGVVLLRGTVPNTEAEKRAVNLAMQTVDVSEVIDELSPLVNSELTPKPAQPVRGGR